MNVSLDSINKKAKDPVSFIRSCDDVFANCIASHAKYIEENCMERPVVLLSGPYSSGKKAVTDLLDKQLKADGFEVVRLNGDDFLRSCNAQERLLHEKRRFDALAPEMIDANLFSMTINDLLVGREAKCGKYDFSSMQQIGSHDHCIHTDGGVILIEGVHTLNPIITRCIPNDRSIKIYADVETEIEHNGKTLSSQKIRLLRRMLKGKYMLGRNLKKTYNDFNSVCDIEKKNPIPYRDRAEIVIDTFHEYEICVWRNMIINELAFSCRKMKLDEITDFMRNTESIEFTLESSEFISGILGLNDI